jgi:hypothetical protein
VETRQVRNDYTFRWAGRLYQIQPGSVISGMRGASVRVEKRLDGSLAVRYAERYLTVQMCDVAEKSKARPSPQPAPVRRTGVRGSDWNENFDFEEGPQDLAGGCAMSLASMPGETFFDACGIYRPDVSSSLESLARSAAFRSGPGQAEERAGRKHVLPIVAMSSGRLFRDRVGRHQSPSPLH